MTFDEKIVSCVLKFQDIQKPDYASSEIDYYADFIELVVLFAGEDGITQGDIQDRFFGEKDYSNAGERDEDEAFLKSIFLRIEERITLFSNDYPFSYLENEILTLKLNLSINNKLYLSLLLSSKLNIFKDLKSELTTDFESISYSVLKNFLPTHSIVKEFGKNTSYIGNAIDKIKQLANDLDLAVNEYEISQVGSRNNQERGLDIIGWIPFGDNCGNKVIYLCQCACGKQYESKQHDTRRFENYLQFYKTNPQHTLFIPYSLINFRAKKFYHSDCIEKDYLIFERKRILEYYQADIFDTLQSKQIVEKCVVYNISEI
ncbi:MAG: hypothetical protein Q4C98_01940 [Capnocytophaga sp.]|nr:hypothetical protein [Capnocytophaga sp.]